MDRKPGAADLRRELEGYRERWPKLADDDLFVLWFLRAFVTEREEDAASALVGGANDKGLDAVLVDDRTRNVFFVQGKYRAGIDAKSEKRPDVLNFAQLALDAFDSGERFDALLEKLAPGVDEKLREARERVLKRKYRPQLFYVTTGRCSEALASEASRLVRTAEVEASLRLIGGSHIMSMFSDYLDGVAPPVPSLDLEMEAGHGVDVEGPLHRYDAQTGVDSWVFSMTSASIAELYAHTGTRLFARNVRGFLGSTEINQGMEQTLRKEPAYFWYYNNGITIVCDQAEEVRAGGRRLVRVGNPQVINGQQTTRTLARVASNSRPASVLVRVIRVPRDAAVHPEGFETFVSNIVAATNWQNAIRPSDLMSNDRKQIEIDRQLRQLGFGYIRKRQTKGEARRAIGRQYELLKKEEVAQAVAACDLDPQIVREGKENLFEEKWYSKVFPTTDPYYYLTRFALHKEVSSVAWGYPERAYAKWVVLNFMWVRVRPLMRGSSSSDRFVKAWQRGDPAMRDLGVAIAVVFRSALKFYRAHRGRGARASDVSTFFKRRKLGLDFSRFWKSGSSRERRAFRRPWERFESWARSVEGSHNLRVRRSRRISANSYKSALAST